jgi:hypothetical protein
MGRKHVQAINYEPETLSQFRVVVLELIKGQSLFQKDIKDGIRSVAVSNPNGERIF